MYPRQKIFSSKSFIDNELCYLHYPVTIKLIFPRSVIETIQTNVELYFMDLIKCQMANDKLTKLFKSLELTLD